MIDGLGRYPGYRKSGISWMGEVPNHWPIVRLKTIFHEVDRRSGTGTEPLLSLRMQQGLVDHHQAGGKLIPAANLTHYKVTQVGELVMNRMRAAAGLFGVTPKTGLVSPDYAVLRPKGSANLNYFGILFRTPMMMSVFRLESRGLGTGESGFLRLYTESFGTLPAAIPPLDEQAAIVRFLDHADRRIRRYIAAKQKLIKLLEEQKQAIIHRAVTRGLDPNVRLKPSGVDWLGDVPEHWRVRRLRSLADIRTGGRDTAHKKDDGEWPFYVRSQTVERIDTWSFDGEAVLTAGDGAGVAKVFHYVNGKFDFHQRVYKFSGFREVSGPFFFQYFRAVLRFEAFRSTAKSTVDSLRLPMLQNLPVLIPPPSEQKELVSFLSGQTSAVDATIQTSRAEINFLREYRTRLFSDVVTGKLDVRAAAAALPDELDEAPELLDDEEENGEEGLDTTEDDE